mmetsp:Transcript_25294/g.36977  ORF Transcript_25294/g.36977 Transcript_25294/m.36977 type:complete len:245 (-) Transcript_25294:102-836(-)|eukprot:CAMPEP_0194046534 /NCGR_PEP_ID=MMETSP0009_2-20130614/21511_1 /TAXON_ID=210454 /ORGANISM="Grammatophora oceanica, Strain CCMP 410" /LENGTH=244 /DNA_ID=CAMNT_0038691863 /DNA_START=29 /DNA_END=763 /DNA_ORIENTATION=+
MTMMMMTRPAPLLSLLFGLLLLLTTTTFAQTTEEGLAFLKENKEKEGVIELPSGLQYKVLNKGTGAFHPGPNTPCSCHYQGTLIDGTQFDSSYDRGSPTSFAPSGVIKGWTEAMQLMVEGDKWEMYIPSELGYGDRGAGANIPGGAVLIFVMELIKIEGEDKVPALSCDVTNPQDACNEKEIGYIDRLKAKGDDDVSTFVAAQIKRLEGMKGNKMAPELLEWLERRLHILKQFEKPAADGGDEL